LIGRARPNGWCAASNTWGLPSRSPSQNSLKLGEFWLFSYQLARNDQLITRMAATRFMNCRVSC
jgi:hypothetical protein